MIFRTGESRALERSMNRPKVTFLLSTAFEILLSMFKYPEQTGTGCTQVTQET